MKKFLKFRKINSRKITSGGSAANTIATAAQFGGDCYFIGRVANDEFGVKFINEIEKLEPTLLAIFVIKIQRPNPLF